MTARDRRLLHGSGLQMPASGCRIGSGCPVDIVPTGKYTVPMTDQVVPMNETHEATYLGRLLDTLELVTGGAAVSSFRDAARTLRIPPSTAHRLLTLLLERGYCDRTDSGTFQAGPRLVSIGMRALDQLPQWAAASTLISELGELTGESASLGILIGDEIVLIARHNSPHMLAAFASVGDVLSPYKSALGKAILANIPRERQTRVIDRFAPGGTTEILRSLEGEMAEALQRGYSVDEETFQPGMRCRAVPVFDATSVLLGGISVSGPSVRFTSTRAEAAIPLLQDAARRLISSPSRQSTVTTRFGSLQTRLTGTDAKSNPRPRRRSSTSHA
jgi:DNA-binding IclR family transcriptional regulator